MGCLLAREIKKLKSAVLVNDSVVGVDNTNFGFGVELELSNLFLLIFDSMFFTRLLKYNLPELSEHVHDLLLSPGARTPLSFLT